MRYGALFLSFAPWLGIISTLLWVYEPFEASENRGGAQKTRNTKCLHETRSNGPHSHLPISQLPPSNYFSTGSAQNLFEELSRPLPPLHHLRLTCVLHPNLVSSRRTPMARSFLRHLRRVVFTPCSHDIDCTSDSPTSDFPRVPALPRTTSPPTCLPSI